MQNVSTVNGGEDLDAEAEQEAVALWIELYGQPPAIQSDFRTLLSVVVSTLPEPPAGPPAQD